MHDIEFAAREPLEERLVGIIQNLVPLFVPIQVVGLGRPKILRVVMRDAHGGVAVFDAGAVNHNLRRQINFGEFGNRCCFFIGHFCDFSG